MSRNDKARLRRRTIGYVFQDYNLLPGLTAAENVSLPLELDGLPARKARAAGLAALEELGLTDEADRYPDQLSGGERQRVAIARAVVGDRRLLLADEPSGALDSGNAESVMRLVHDACKNGGMAAVVVTHDAQLASWADRVRLPAGRPGHRPDRPAGERGVPAHARSAAVTVTLQERPVRARTGNGGIPARRAVIRWAWRLLRREWRQQLLILGLITVAVAATFVGAAVATNTPPPAAPASAPRRTWRRWGRARTCPRRSPR